MQNTNLHEVRIANSGFLMKIISRSLAITFLALFLQGCELDDGTDSDDDEQTVVYSTDGGTSTLTNDSKYELILRADSSFLTLEDNITEITIQGDDNYLIVDEDTSIDSISINGDENIIVVDDDLRLTVDHLSIQGNGNSVTVYDIGTYTETSDVDGADNLACEVGNSGICMTESN